MLFALDIGNSNIVISVMDDSKIHFVARLDTNMTKTEDEYLVNINDMLVSNNVSKSEISGAIISSVVAPLTYVYKKVIQRLFNINPVIIDSLTNTGLFIDIDTPSELGSDLICSAVAGIEKYPLPLIIFDIGTATTVSVIDKNKHFIGGLIYPGPKISLENLSSKTSGLPHITLDTPGNIIEKNTEACMRSGLVYGNASMIDGIIDRIQNHLSQCVTVVATGGLSGFIIPYCVKKIIIDDDLILKGLLSIYKKNKKLFF